MIRTAAEILADINGPTPATEPDGPTLEPVDRYVLGLVADGHTHASIGRKLGKGKSATGMHLGRIYKQLGAVNAPHAVAIAIRAGLLPAYNPGARQQ